MHEKPATINPQDVEEQNFQRQLAENKKYFSKERQELIKHGRIVDPLKYIKKDVYTEEGFKGVCEIVEIVRNIAEEYSFLLTQKTPEEIQRDMPEINRLSGQAFERFKDYSQTIVDECTKALEETNDSHYQRRIQEQQTIEAILGEHGELTRRLKYWHTQGQYDYRPHDTADYAANLVLGDRFYRSHLSLRSGFSWSDSHYFKVEGIFGDTIENAILWEAHRSNEPIIKERENPFIPLLELYRLGATKVTFRDSNQGELLVSDFRLRFGIPQRGPSRSGLNIACIAFDAQGNGDTELTYFHNIDEECDLARPVNQARVILS